MQPAMGYALKDFWDCFKRENPILQQIYRNKTSALLLSERPKLYTILAFLSAIGSKIVFQWMQNSYKQKNNGIRHQLHFY